MNYTQSFSLQRNVGLPSFAKCLTLTRACPYNLSDVRFLSSPVNLLPPISRVLSPKSPSLIRSKTTGENRNFHAPARKQDKVGFTAFFQSDKQIRTRQNLRLITHRRTSGMRPSLEKGVLHLRTANEKAEHEIMLISWGRHLLVEGLNRKACSFYSWMSKQASSFRIEWVDSKQM